MYISPHKVFAHLDRLAGWQQGAKPAPVTVEWDLSNRCSLGCQSCHFAHTHTKGPWAGKTLLPMAYEPSGDLADTVMVKRGLDEMAQTGVQAVVWSGGGEPTLHPDWMEIVAHARRRGLRQGMYTLGGHLTGTKAEFLARHLDWVVVSLDAHDAAAYAKEKGVPEARFDDACEGIRKLAEAKQCVVGVSFLLHAGNWRMMQGMLFLARALGATYTTFRPTIEADPNHQVTVVGDTKWIRSALSRECGPTLFHMMASEPDVEISLERFKNYAEWSGHGYTTCYGIRLTTMVTPDGRMWVCPQRRGMAGSQLGDLRTESFSEIWSRHPGHYLVNSGCRAMCRLHQINTVLDSVYAEREHAAFV